MTSKGQGQVGYLHARIKGDKTHFCIVCDFPVAVYGRLWPCSHAFCLACASDLEVCPLCQSIIKRIERLPAEQGLFISAATLQAFNTEEDLAQHAKRLEDHLARSPALAGSRSL